MITQAGFSFGWDNAIVEWNKSERGARNVSRLLTNLKKEGWGKDGKTFGTHPCRRGSNN